MAIQNRRGAYTNFDPAKMKPGEFAIVQNGDPNSSDGKAVYICTETGVVRRLVSELELNDLVDDAIATDLATKVDKITGMGLSTNNYTNADKTKLAGIEEQATRVLIDGTLSVQGRAAGAKEVGTALASKVDKISGKSLSTNDYTTAEKQKLAGITAGANLIQFTDPNNDGNIVVTLS